MQTIGIIILAICFFVMSFCIYMLHRVGEVSRFFARMIRDDFDYVKGLIDKYGSVHDALFYVLWSFRKPVKENFPI